jgi:hypothetical protein
MEIALGMILPEALAQLDQIASDAVEIAQEDLRRTLYRRILSGTPIDTGELWSGWNVESVAEGFDITNPVPYAYWVEIGAGWPSPGPRTIADKGGIWSRQAVGGIIAPIFEDDSWLDDAVSLIVEYIQEELQS